MSEQEKISSLISEFERVVADAAYPDRPRGFMMPYELAEKILDLLSVREPRLLTFDELKALSGTARTVYVERRTKTFYNETAFISVEKVYGENVIFHGQKSIFGHVKKDYGKVWRCWTSQPTDNQRREAKWIE